MSNNVAVFIDGFNFYHAIKAHIKNIEYPRSLKWLNYRALVEEYILRNVEYDKLQINFYTAINTFKFNNDGSPHSSIEHHKTYTNALKSVGINVIEGKFKLRDEPLNTYYECKKCFKTHFIHKFDLDLPQKIICPDCKTVLSSNDLHCIKKVEEKKTDVRIAIDLVNCARDGVYNKIYLFSTDSDFIPPVEYIKTNCKDVCLTIVAPSDKVERKVYNKETKRVEGRSVHRYGTSEFSKLNVSVHRLKFSKLINYLFDDELKDESNRIIMNPWIK